MISSMAVVNETGDVIAGMDYSADADFTQDLQLRRCPKPSSTGTSSSPSDYDPVSMQDGLRYYWIERNGLYFKATSKSSSDKLSSFAIIEILSKFHELCRDLLGTPVTEEVLRSNVAVVNEILLEFMDLGLVQLCTVDKLRPHICSEVVHRTGSVASTDDKDSRTSQRKPTIFGMCIHPNRNEVFLDVIERVNVTVAKDTTVLRSHVYGRLDIKCAVRREPLIRIALNQDLAVDAVNSCDTVLEARQALITVKGGNVRLDSCRFHEVVNLDRFASHRILSLVPSAFGTCLTLMTYTLNSSPLAVLPFRLQHTVTAHPQLTDLDVKLVLRCQVAVPAKAAYVTARLQVPHSTTSLMSRLTGGSSQSTEFEAASSMVVWRIKKFEGGSEVTARLRLVDGNVCPEGCLLELGPLALEFELSAYACSGLTIRSLDVVFRSEGQRRRSQNEFERHQSSADEGDFDSSEPARWVRYICHSNSYVFRLH